MEVEEFNKPQEERTPPTEEEKKAQEKFLRSGIIMRYKNTLKDIYQYIKENNLSLETLKEEIEAKKCKLSTSRRDFIRMFQLTFLQDIFNDLEEIRNANN